MESEAAIQLTHTLRALSQLRLARRRERDRLMQEALAHLGAALAAHLQITHGATEAEDTRGDLDLTVTELCEENSPT